MPALDATAPMLQCAETLGRAKRAWRWWWTTPATGSNFLLLKFMVGIAAYVSVLIGRPRH